MKTWDENPWFVAMVEYEGPVGVRERTPDHLVSGLQPALQQPRQPIGTFYCEAFGCGAAVLTDLFLPPTRVLDAGALGVSAEHRLAHFVAK